MNVPYQPEPHPVRPIAGACPFCNETCAELWRDPSRPNMDHQVRCEMCSARGPWGTQEGAVEAWESVVPKLADGG